MSLVAKLKVSERTHVAATGAAAGGAGAGAVTAGGQLLRQAGDAARRDHEQQRQETPSRHHRSSRFWENGATDCLIRPSSQGCQMAKFDPFLSLDCARVEGVGAQSKERKGSNFAA